MRDEVRQIDCARYGDTSSRRQWSEWGWSAELKHYYRARLNGDGKYEYEYEDEEHYDSIPSPPLGQAATASQSYSDMRNTVGQATGLEGAPRTLEATREEVSHQSLHGSWPLKFFETPRHFDRKAENQPYIEWLKDSFDEDNEDGEEVEEDVDENRDDIGGRERNGEMDQPQNQQSNTWNYPRSCYPKSDYSSCYQASPASSYPASSNAPAKTLDPRFRVHASKEFKFGRVFNVLWAEPKGSGGTEIIFPAVTGSGAYHKIRRFLVVRTEDRHSTCIPILTYSGQGINKSGVYADDHAFIYSSNTSKEKWKGVGKSKDDMTVKMKHQDGHNLRGLDPASQINYSKIYTVEHNVKVCFTGHMDETNVERLLCGDLAWERSDTGEDIPVIMEDQVYPSFGCRCRRFQLLDKHTMSNKMIALLGLSSGLLMSSSFVWLNDRMELYEPSEIMSKIVNAAIFHPEFGRLSSMIPNEIICAFFFLGAAGITGTTIIGLGRSQNQAGLVFGLTLAGTITSWILGFSAEEIILVCLPLILGFSILCGSVLQWKKVGLVERDEKAEMISEV